MANVATVENGVVTSGINTSQMSATSSSSISEASTSSSDVYDEDMFLQLLVAEMQYQDPLEPTSNTEYVSELASFTQIEAMQNIDSTVSDAGAESLVGKYVTITTDDGTQVTGLVDFTQKKDDGTYVSVNDNLYSTDNITYVYSDDYYEASMTAVTFSSMISKLPSEDDLTLDDAEQVEAARTLYDSMSSYTLAFVSADDVSTLETLEKRIAAMQEAKENAEELVNNLTTDDDNTSDEEVATEE